MIVEFALSLTFSIPNSAPPLVEVEFTQPVREVVTYPPEGILNQVSGLRLPAGTQEIFEDEFVAGQPFFGAFAINKDFAYGYVTGTNSLEAAREIALQECLGQGGRCLIFAEILPQGYVPLDAGQVSLAPEPEGYYSNPDPSWGSFRAMAISEDGAYSLVWNYGSRREAQEAALADCRQYTIDDLPDLRPMPCILIPFK